MSCGWSALELNSRSPLPSTALAPGNHSFSKRIAARLAESGLGLLTNIAGYSSPMSQACSRSFFEYARNAVRV